MAAVSKTTSHVPVLARKLIIVAISAALPVLCLEFFFRYLARCCPQAQGLFTAMQLEWFQRHDLRNSLGFRDVEHGQPTKPRLAVVGDSFAWGWGIERDQDRYGEVLAAMLGWESVNASRGNTDTLDHIVFLETILPLNPRAVVLLYVFNDARYLLPKARHKVFLGVLFNHSHLYQQIVARWHLYSVPEQQIPYQDDRLLARHVADLARFAGIAEASGVEVVIVPFPHAHRDVPFTAKPPSESNYLRLVAALQKASVPVWPIHEAFTGCDRDSLSVNSLDTHPNERALRIAAEATLPYFQH